MLNLSFVKIMYGNKSISMGMSIRVHHLPRIFAAPPGHPTASGFNSIEYVYEIFLNLINVWDMHNAKENSIELDRIDRMSKINFQNMTIFTSYPMYFDALNTNINLKNRKCNILWSFWLQNWSFLPNQAIMAKWAVFGPKWPQYVTFAIFRVHICVQRIEIHKIRCKNRHILKIYFWHFIYFLIF